jgi:uncharacterized protein (TIGR02231 family)
MHRFITAYLALAIAALAAPERTTHEVNSGVSAVTVFLDRALVERVARVTLEPGESTILLSDLPANLWDHSLQISGHGPDGTTVLDVQSRNRFLTAEPSPLIRELEEKLRDLSRQRDVLTDERGALEHERSVLKSINAAATTIPEEGGDRASFDEWRELLKFNADENRRIQNGLRDIAVRTQSLQDEINAAQQQLNEVRGRTPNQRAVKEVEVRVATPASGPVELTVSYTVPGANWTPTYRARLDSESRRVALDYQAQVINRTGEAWEDVALTLSTARPSAGGSAPEAMPWIVEELRVQAAKLEARHYAAESLAMPAAMADSVEAPARERNQFIAQQATVEAGLTSASFKVAALATIPADGTNHRVSITTIDLPAGLRYDTTPKYNTAAFLTAKVTNDSEFPLLGGSMAAFVDGAFIANSYLATTMANEEFDLALGVDDTIAVERTLVNRFVEKTGFTNSGHRVTYEYAIEVTNNQTSAITLQLAEPLPVSQHEKIIVKILEPNERQIGDPEDNSAFKRDNEGILTWTGSLAAGATRTMNLKFSIEHPADMNVTGIE